MTGRILDALADVLTAAADTCRWLATLARVTP